MNAKTFCEHFATFAEAPNSIARLRELVFQLAVKGKVVPQHDDDEPADALFSQIQAERSRLIAEGVMRRGKPLPPVGDDELIFQIPTAWKWIRFDDVGDWGAGATPNRGRPEYFGGDIKWFKSGELNDAYIDDSEEKITELALKECSLRENQPGDVLVAMYGATIGKVAILAVPATTNQAVCACTCHGGIFNRYLFLMLKAFKSYFISNSSGAAQPNFSKEKIVRTPFPLPPLAEQRRIVAKVDQLLRLCDELAARQAARREARSALVAATLDRLVSPSTAAEFPTHAGRLRNHFDQLFDIPTTIPQLRQTILQLAFTGKLTERHPDDGSAVELIDRLKVAHRLEWEGSELIQFRMAGDLPKSDKWKSRYPTPDEPILEGAEEIPTTWRWISAALACPIFVDSPHRTPKYAFNGKYPALRPRDVANGELKLKQAARVNDEEFARQTQRRKPQPGDIVYSRELSYGWAIVIPPNTEICLSQGMVSMRPHEEIDTEYLLKLLNSPVGRLQAAKVALGAAHPHVNLKDIRKFRIPLPPLAEQKRIVAKVTELLSLCDDLEAKLTQAESASSELLAAAVHHLLNATSPGSPAHV